MSQSVPPGGRPPDRPGATPDSDRGGPPPAPAGGRADAPISARAAPPISPTATGERPITAGALAHSRNKPRPPARTRAYVLALIAHVLLAAFLIIGVDWRSEPPVAVQAELWEPPSRPDPTPVKPDPKPEPKPEPPPPPPPPPPPEPKPEPPKVDPDIALEKERLRKEQLKAQQEAERRELERREAQRKQEEQKLAEQKLAEQKRQAELKQQAERQQAEKEAQARKEAEAKKAAEDKARKEAQARQDAKTRNDYLERLQAMAGGDTPRSGTPRAGAAVGGSAGGTTGAADGAYSSKVAGAIRANTVFSIPSDLTGNPQAQFTVSLLPDCSIASVRMTRSSGYPSWDQAAERAIQRTDPFPRPPSGACQREFTINSGPRDRN